MRNCTEDEGRPLGVGLQEQASNHLKLHRLRAFVVSVKEKAWQRLCQVWIKEIGIGGHFLAERHVMDHLETEQIQATVIDRRVREDWQADGAKSLRLVANQKAKEILETHRPDPLPDDMVAELKRIVKKAEDF